MNSDCIKKQSLQFACNIDGYFKPDDVVDTFTHLLTDWTLCKFATSVQMPCLIIIIDKNVSLMALAIPP